jgi:uncharacterized repeat protein (TIGR03803 family)
MTDQPDPTLPADSNRRRLPDSLPTWLNRGFGRGGRCQGVMATLLLTAAAALCLPTTVAAQSEEVLHSFNTGGGDEDAIFPYAELLQASDGNFYSTTGYGGASNFGTVFKMDSSGNVTILHDSLVLRATAAARQLP